MTYPSFSRTPSPVRWNEAKKDIMFDMMSFVSCQPTATYSGLASI